MTDDAAPPGGNGELRELHTRGARRSAFAIRQSPAAHSASDRMSDHCIDALGSGTSHLAVALGSGTWQWHMRQWHWQRSACRFSRRFSPLFFLFPRSCSLFLFCARCRRGKVVSSHLLQARSIQNLPPNLTQNLPFAGEGENRCRQLSQVYGSGTPQLARFHQ
jgi:hypothetical protein